MNKDGRETKQKKPCSSLPIRMAGGRLVNPADTKTSFLLLACAMIDLFFFFLVGDFFFRRKQQNSEPRQKHAQQTRKSKNQQKRDKKKTKKKKKKRRRKIDREKEVCPRRLHWAAQLIRQQTRDLRIVWLDGILGRTSRKTARSIVVRHTRASEFGKHCKTLSDA